MPDVINLIDESDEESDSLGSPDPVPQVQPRRNRQSLTPAKRSLTKSDVDSPTKKKRKLRGSKEGVAGPSKSDSPEWTTKKATKSEKAKLVEEIRTADEVEEAFRRSQEEKITTVVDEELVKAADEAETETRASQERNGSDGDGDVEMGEAEVDTETPLFTAESDDSLFSSSVAAPLLPTTLPSAPVGSKQTPVATERKEEKKARRNVARKQRSEREELFARSPANVTRRNAARAKQPVVVPDEEKKQTPIPLTAPVRVVFEFPEESDDEAEGEDTWSLAWLGQVALAVFAICLVALFGIILIVVSCRMQLDLPGSSMDSEDCCDILRAYCPTIIGHRFAPKELPGGFSGEIL